MNRKDKLIIGILKKDLKSIKKTLKDQEEQIADIEKNGFDKEIHKDNRLSIRTGLSYTQGYCTGHICLTEKIIHLLQKSDARDIEAIIEEDRIVSKKNKAEMKKLFDGIKKSFKEKTKKLNDNKKKSKA